MSWANRLSGCVASDTIGYGPLDCTGVPTMNEPVRIPLGRQPAAKARARTTLILVISPRGSRQAYMPVVRGFVRISAYTAAWPARSVNVSGAVNVGDNSVGSLPSSV
jgi:hypothetical protein